MENLFICPAFHLIEPFKIVSKLVHRLTLKLVVLAFCLSQYFVLTRDRLMVLK